MIWRKVMNTEEFEFFEFTEEEEANWLEMLYEEAMREKIMVYTQDAPKRIKAVVGGLKLILKAEQCNYTLYFERCEVFQRSIYVHIETADFGASQKNFWIFQDIIREVDSFEVSWLPIGKVKLSFYLNLVFLEMK